MTGVTLQEGQADLPTSNSTASYWHKEPSRALLGHRTTPSLPSTTDVVIIGSGIAGSFAARELKEKWPESDVLVLEAREACWGATGRNGGHCQPLTYASSPAISHFELRTYAYLRDLITKNAIPCGWRALQGVHAFYTPDLLAGAANRLADLERTHPDLASKARVVRSATELADLNIPDAVGAVVQETAASCWPYKLICWILEDLLQRFGAEDKTDVDSIPAAAAPAAAAPGQGKAGRSRFNLQTNTPVTHLQKLDTKQRGSADHDNDGTGPRWIVHTPRGQVASRHVLLASNGYTSHLLPSFSDLIVPVQGQVAALLPPPTVDDDQSEQRHLQLQRSYVFMGTPPDGSSQDDYLIQRSAPQEELILGGGRSRAAKRGVGISSDERVDTTVASYLRRSLYDSMGGIEQGKKEGDAYGGRKELEATHEWTGIMGFSRDGCPWVGNVPASLGGCEGLWIAAGFTGHGMPQAALCARAVVGMMVGGSSSSTTAETDDDAALPGEFRVSEERVSKAREKETVKQMDDKEMFI